MTLDTFRRTGLRRVVALLTLPLLGGCSMHVLERPLRPGDLVEVSPRHSPATVIDGGVVHEVRPGRVTVTMARGDTLVLRDNTSYHVTVVEGKRGVGVIPKAVLAGFVIGVTPGVALAFSRTDGNSQHAGTALLYAVVGGGLLGAVLAGIAGLAQMGSEYRLAVPAPVPPPRQ